MMASELVWHRYVSVLTRKPSAPSTEQMATLLSMLWADRFHRALRILFSVDSCKDKNAAHQSALLFSSIHFYVWRVGIRISNETEVAGSSTI